MPLKHIKGDILSWPSIEPNDLVISLQQVNTRGVYNAGLAQQTRKKYPEVYSLYRLEYLVAKEQNFNKRLNLGDFIKIPTVGQPFKGWFYLLVAQDTYGRTGLYTDYKALDLCLDNVYTDMCNNGYDLLDYKVLIPYGMGCGLGGGDWSVVSGLIEKYFPHATITQYLSE